MMDIEQTHRTLKQQHWSSTWSAAKLTYPPPTPGQATRGMNTAGEAQVASGGVDNSAAATNVQTHSHTAGDQIDEEDLK